MHVKKKFGDFALPIHMTLARFLASGVSWGSCGLRLTKGNMRRYLWGQKRLGLIKLIVE